MSSGIDEIICLTDGCYSYTMAARSAGKRDKVNHVELIEDTEVDGKRRVKLRRPLDTGDDTDFTIDPSGGFDIVWAQGRSAYLSYHKYRGAVSNLEIASTAEAK